MVFPEVLVAAGVMIGHHPEAEAVLLVGGQDLTVEVVRMKAEDHMAMVLQGIGEPVQLEGAMDKY